MNRCEFVGFAALAPLVASETDSNGVPADKPLVLLPDRAPVLALVAFSVFINCVDRGHLSISAPLIKDALRLSASQLGILGSSLKYEAQR